MFGIILATALLALPLAANAKPASDVAACLESAARQPRTVFEVAVTTYPTIVDRSLSIAGINILRPVKLPPRAIAHGLSVAQYHLRYNVRSETTCWHPGGHACAWLGSVQVDLTPDSIRIYIPKEDPPGGCEDAQLALHEMEHERLHRRRVLETADKMRRALADAKGLPGSNTPINASSPEEAYVRLKSMVDKVVRPIYDDFLEKSRAEQGALDDAKHYRRLGESCTGWKRL